jgi:cytochrome c-type biogenesis protein CcmH/NrfF
MYGCWSHQARQKIAHMQAAGLSDSAIVDDFVRAYGEAIYRAAPGALGWAIPYLMLALGAAVVVRFLRRALP